MMPMWEYLFVDSHPVPSADRQSVSQFWFFNDQQSQFDCHSYPEWALLNILGDDGWEFVETRPESNWMLILKRPRSQ